MIIQKVLSDDFIIAQDENNKDVIIFGKDLIKTAIPKEKVNTNQIERILKANDSVEFAHLIELIQESNKKDFRMVNEVVQICEEELQSKIDFKLYLSLSDHILFAFERLSQGINFRNQLLKEIKKYYPQEFEIGKKALLKLKEKYNLEVPEDEAGYIALHLANSNRDLQIHVVETTARIINLSLKTIEFINNIKIKEDSLYYKRFIRHLKNCINRAFTGKMLKDEDEIFFEMIKEKFPKPYSTAKRISNYLYNQYSIILTEDEIVNLTVHINQLIETNR